MIPPIKEVRLRSINRWLKDKGQTPQSGAQSPRAQDLDDQMIEAFEAQDDALMDRLMKANLWGTEEGLRQYRTEQMALWQEVCAEFLPTSVQD